MESNRPKTSSPIWIRPYKAVTQHSYHQIASSNRKLSSDFETLRRAANVTGYSIQPERRCIFWQAQVPGLDQPANGKGPPGLTPLLWWHINPYGLFRLDMNTRLAVEKTEAAAKRPYFCPW